MVVTFGVLLVAAGEDGCCGDGGAVCPYPAATPSRRCAAAASGDGPAAGAPAERGELSAGCPACERGASPAWCLSGASGESSTGCAPAERRGEAAEVAPAAGSPAERGESLVRCAPATSGDRPAGCALLAQAQPPEGGSVGSAGPPLHKQSCGLGLVWSWSPPQVPPQEHADCAPPL